MRFVVSKRFLLLAAVGVLPLGAVWVLPQVGYGVAIYDLLLVFAAVTDHMISRRRLAELQLQRGLERRFAIGAEAIVKIRVHNPTSRTIRLRIKDEYPDQLQLIDPREAEFDLQPQMDAEFSYRVKPARRGKYQFGRTAVRIRSILGLVWSQGELGETETVKVYPNIRRAREIELKALGAQSYMSIQRRSIRRGEGREFESMRDYVRGDELRHISWTATARRTRLTTRQYQIEREQNVVVAIDAGRLMTGRVDGETKFESAVHAALALVSASARSGDNCGLVVFGRRIRTYLPPKRGTDHIDAMLESLHDIEPDLIEPSYARAFQFISSNIKKRSFVAVLTDVIDKDSSRELIHSLRLLRPRHLPLVLTVGDRDLRSAVSSEPASIREVFTQSAAEEVILQRESALRLVESIGGLAVDVNTQTLAPRLLQTYLRVKERGLL